ncbi:hypothetical protein Leryth_000850 [Lithospermum erythrorhizon]|nr:hypothetical protein Leryth_000850 [Lithospermum erythrorhizon]
MTTGWVKSLQCKSKVLTDVVVTSNNVNSKNYQYNNHIVPHSTSCRKSVQGLKDVIETNKKNKPKKPKPPTKPPEPPQKQPKQPVSGDGVDRNRSKVYTIRSTAIEALFPALTELPLGHPSRNVVEIIFHTSWSNKNFSGRIEMVFKVQNMTRTLTRFEEYREVVKSKASSVDSRCVADGNEVMRFYCLGGACGAWDSSGGEWGICGGKGVCICTYSGSGGAHEKAGGGNGRRAMLVCRVIAGRVLKETSRDSVAGGRVGYESVSRGNDELLVFDSRAVLPCFLIIYKL